MGLRALVARLHLKLRPVDEKKLWYKAITDTQHRAECKACLQQELYEGLKAVYSAEEVERIEMSAAAHGLATIPRGLSFSSGRRDLTDPTILQLMIDTGSELLSAHPRSKMIHFGGDEMFAVASTPSMVKARLEVGLSGFM